MLRASTLAPYAARFSDEEVVVGGFTLPPKVCHRQVEAVVGGHMLASHTHTHDL